MWLSARLHLHYWPAKAHVPLRALKKIPIPDFKRPFRRGELGYAKVS